MPEIPLSDGARGARFLPLGVAAETLAAERPSTATLARAEEMAEEVAAGENENSFLELVRHAAAIEKRPPALEIVLKAVLAKLLPEPGQVGVYAGRLFYCLKLQEKPEPVAVDPRREEALAERSRQALAQSLLKGQADSIDEAVARGLKEAVLETVQAEAAEEVRRRGPGWLEESWLAPHRFDYVFQHAELTVEEPSIDDLLYALAGYPRLVEGDADQTRVLALQMVKRHVLPRLLARRFPAAVATAERLMEEEPLFASMQDFFEITQEARRLLDQPLEA